MHDPNEIHTAEPSILRAGDSAKWKITEASYPASVWTMTYVLINAAAKQTIVAVADGDDHSISLAPADTAKYAHGDYEWQAAVSDGADRYTIRQGRITVIPDFANADHKTLDTRSTAARTLDAINAVIEGRAGDAELSYSIAGRSLQFIPVPDLLNLQSTYEGKVSRELAAERLSAGKSTPKSIKVRL